MNSMGNGHRISGGQLGNKGGGGDTNEMLVIEDVYSSSSNNGIHVDANHIINGRFSVTVF